MSMGIGINFPAIQNPCPLLLIVSKVIILQKSTKRKSQLDRLTLVQHTRRLDEVLQQPWIKFPSWSSIKQAVQIFSDNLRDYAKYLHQKNEEIQSNHMLLHVKRPESTSITVIIRVFLIMHYYLVDLNHWD